MANNSAVLRVLIFAMLYCTFGKIALGTTIQIDPSVLSVTQSQAFSLDVAITDVVDLYAYQFDVSFDPALMQASDITEGAFLSGGGATNFFAGLIDNTAGTIMFTADTLQGFVSGVTGSGILASINFNALDLGSSAIALSNVQLLDSNLDDISASITSIGDGSITVSQQVPEIGILWLVASGLPLFLGFAGRCQR